MSEVWGKGDFLNSCVATHNLMLISDLYVRLYGIKREIEIDMEDYCNLKLRA